MTPRSLTPVNGRTPPPPATMAGHGEPRHRATPGRRLQPRRTPGER